MLGADVGEYVLGSTFPLVLILSLTSSVCPFTFSHYTPFSEHKPFMFLVLP